jgi:hypothetical protein
MTHQPMSAPCTEFARRRTFATISHPDVGKTTLTEKLLLFAGAIQIMGSVKARNASRHGTAVWMEIERGVAFPESAASTSPSPKPSTSTSAHRLRPTRRRGQDLAKRKRKVVSEFERLLRLIWDRCTRCVHNFCVSEIRQS